MPRGDLTWEECVIVRREECTAILECTRYINIFGYWFAVWVEEKEGEIEGCSPDSPTTEV